MRLLPTSKQLSLSFLPQEGIFQLRYAPKQFAFFSKFLKQNRKRNTEMCLGIEKRIKKYRKRSYCYVEIFSIAVDFRFRILGNILSLQE